MALFTSLAVASFLGVTASFFTASIAFGLNLVVGIGLSLAARALSGDPKQEADTKGNFSIQGTLQAGGDVPRSFQLGYSVTAGSLVWANTHNNDGQTPNAFLTQVIALSDLPGGTLEEFWVNGEKVTLGAVYDGELGVPVTEYFREGRNHLWIKYYDGTQLSGSYYCINTAASVERPYEASRVGTGVAYVVVTALVDDVLFNGFPSFKFAVSGVPLYDPSKDSTVGGSGTHVYSNPATWGGDGDNNPAVQIYNILRGFSYGGEWLYGLQGMSEPRLPAANWIAQINKCRATIVSEAGTEQTYRSGGQINVNARSADAIEAILTACQGRLSEIGGFYKIHLGTPDSPTFTFTDGDILSTEQQVYRPFFALADSINGIQGTYPDPEQGWNTATAPPYYRPDLEVIDGNRRLMASPAFDFVPYPEQVQRLQKSAVEEAQRARTHTLALPPAFWIVEPGDTGTWTSERNGYTAKQFRVDSVSDKASLDVSLNLTEVDPGDYAWDHVTEYTPVAVGPTVVVRPAAQSIGGWTVTAYIIEDGTGAPRRPAILLGWDNTQAGIVGVEFEVRLQATGEVILRGRSDNYAIGSVVISSPAILPITVYEVRGRYIPSSPREMAWTAWIAVTTSNTFLTLADLDASIEAMINAVEQSGQEELDAANNLIASVVANAAALTFTDKKEIRTDLISTTASADASIASATGRVTTLETAKTASDAAFASYQTQVAATFGPSFSTVNSVSTAISTRDASLATYKDEVSATFGPSFSTVSTVSSAVATLNGQAAARYSVTLDVNGYATGFVLLNGGSGVSSFTITTDKFQIAAPGISGGAARPIFTVSAVNGVNKVALRSDMIIDGSITAMHILAGTITATQIAANTITANKIATGAITSASGAIGALSVQTLSIGDDAVTMPRFYTSGSTLSGNNTWVQTALVQLTVNTAGLSGKTLTIFGQFGGSINYTGTGAQVQGELYAYAPGNASGLKVQGVTSHSLTTTMTLEMNGALSWTATGGNDAVAFAAYWKGANADAVMATRSLLVSVAKR